MDEDGACSEVKEEHLLCALDQKMKFQGQGGSQASGRRLHAACSSIVTGKRVHARHCELDSGKGAQKASGKCCESYTCRNFATLLCATWLGRTQVGSVQVGSVQFGPTALRGRTLLDALGKKENGKGVVHHRQPQFLQGGLMQLNLVCARWLCATWQTCLCASYFSRVTLRSWFCAQAEHLAHRFRR